MPADLRSALRRETGTGAAGRTLPLAVVLTVLVIVAAGLAGTANFTGPRWYPRIGTGSQTSHTTPPPQTTLPRSRKHPSAKPARGAGLGVLVVPIAVVVLIVLAYLLWRWFRARRLAPHTLEFSRAAGTTPVPAPEPEPEPAKLRTGIELALQALDEEREPADAVVRAWLGVQQTAEESGIVRTPSETPTEFASRVLTRAFADAQPLHTLLRLYLRTRFGDHPVTADDVSAVREALERLLTSWRATAGATEPGERRR